MRSPTTILREIRKLADELAESADSQTAELLEQQKLRLDVLARQRVHPSEYEDDPVLAPCRIVLNDLIRARQWAAVIQQIQLSPEPISCEAPTAEIEVRK